MIKNLIKIANSLDKRGFSKEADMIDALLNKIAGGNEQDDDYTPYYHTPSYDDDDEPLEDTDIMTNLKHVNMSPDDISEDLYEENLPSESDKYTRTPELGMVNRMAAVEKLMDMSDEEFEELARRFPKTLNNMFGSGSLVQSSRVKKRFK